jgi:hypothetical protein
MPGLALRPCRGAPGIECGALIPAATKDRRCPRCRRAASAAKAARNRETGRSRWAVRQAMAEAVRSAGACRSCGRRPPEVRLGAHLPGGGLHPPDPAAYVVLCGSCHAREEWGP